MIGGLLAAMALMLWWGYHRRSTERLNDLKKEEVNEEY